MVRPYYIIHLIMSSCHRRAPDLLSVCRLCQCCVSTLHFQQITYKSNCVPLVFC